MHQQALQIILNAKKSAAARNWKKALRGFVDHCLAMSMIKVDPLIGIKPPKMKKSSGRTEDKIAQYEKRHLPGTKARLALVLLLQTGHARADVVRMGRQHIKNAKLSMRRQKTQVAFDIPVLPALLEELERHPKTEQLAFLTTERGEPFSAPGFGNKFREWCDQAGLPIALLTGCARRPSLGLGNAFDPTLTLASVLQRCETPFPLASMVVFCAWPGRRSR